MAVTKLPGFFDYLGQGIQQFSENRMQRSREETARKYQALQALTGLYQSGGIDAGTFQQQLSTIGIPGISGLKINPSETQQKREFIGGLPEDQRTSASAERFGITPPEDRTMKRERHTADVASTRAGTAASVAQTEKSTYELGEAKANETTRRARAALDLGDEQAKQYDAAGKRYVGAVLAGGRADAKNSKRIVDQAFAKYLQDRQTSGVGVLADPTIVRAHFENALHDLAMEQRKLDIQAAAASNRIDPETRTLQALIQLENNTAARANQIIQGMGEAAKLYLDKPIASVPPAFQSVVKEYQDAQDFRERVRNAITTMSPKEIQAVLGGMQQPQIVPQGQQSAAGQQPAAVQQPSVPAARQPSSAPPATDPAVYKQRIAMMKQLDPAIQKQLLDRNLASGLITQDEYNKMKKELGIK